MLKRMWKDFAEFWKTQVFWALLILAGTLFVQWRKGTFAAGKFGENVADNLIPYGAIVAVFIVGNIARTLFLTEKDELRKKRRLTRREEHRAERKAELDRLEQAKPKLPKPNLQFRRIFDDRLWYGHEISGHAADVVLIEIGNELADGVGSADSVRAHVTYRDFDGNQLQILCPGFWSTQEDEAKISVGESGVLVIAVLKGSNWMTNLYHGISLSSRVRVEVRLLDKAGQSIAEPMFFELGFGNSRYPTSRRVQAAS